ncbi:diacylglycerol kinase [Hydrogenimonas urashimensis]|uniref:diacylglycerol kinase n=1 Tax=Hydrogenimonas urashimensis TaxID=2740515 RepID=UPI0019150682|nr:diacylglycerol kinase [Hydrogenimonas urashimensis]
MRNQPKYSLFRNAGYAMEGFFEVFSHETSFKIEVILSVIVWVALPFVPMPLIAKAVLGLSMLLVLIAELANSAIERTVDLVTRERHTLAKHAKDAGATMVLFTVIFTIAVWLVTLYIVYFE